MDPAVLAAPAVAPAPAPLAPWMSSRFRRPQLAAVWDMVLAGGGTQNRLRASRKWALIARLSRQFSKLHKGVWSKPFKF
jgi:hypothetical protein